MSRKRDSRDERGAAPLSRRRRSLYMAITLLLPVLLIGAAELALRVACRSCSTPLFVPAPFVAEHDVANRDVGRRWFAGLVAPPAPMPEPFAVTKPPRAFRVFVLGESSAAGFPYPRNGTFSRLLRDVLRDVLPEDSVEVVNLGIAATNSFTMLDMADEIARRRPDAVLIYAGHNEYYGALGVGWRERAGGLPVWAVRGYLAMMRLSLANAMRSGVLALQRSDDAGEAVETASLMELLGRGHEFPLDSDGYGAGVAQFESNLESLVRRFRRDDVPVLVGSLASNLRDRPPFASAENATNGAMAAFDTARASLASGDTARARELFTRARELDVIRFRAPSEFNAVIARVTARTGAILVPVAAAFARESPGGIPGGNLFLEHVHPNRDGYALIARTFYETMLERGVLGPSARPDAFRSWSAYLEGQALTPLDARIAVHTTRTLEGRWPFVPIEAQRDYRGRYRPVDLLDSLALATSRGARWEEAKLRMAADYERRSLFDSAAAEYAGLVRDAPFFAEPHRLAGRALVAAGRLAAAESAYRRAVEIEPTAATLAALGALVVQRRNLREGIALLRQSLVADPRQPAVLYQLSLAYGMMNDVPNARETALRLARMAPEHPGLAEWLRLLHAR